MRRLVCALNCSGYRLSGLLALKAGECIVDSAYQTLCCEAISQFCIKLLVEPRECALSRVHERMDLLSLDCFHDCFDFVI
jgi:hypothetical protein